MISTLYIFLLSGLCVLVQRVPAPKFKPMDPLEGLVVLGVYVAVAFVGWNLPEFLQYALGWGLGPGWLLRLSQVFGAVGLLYVAIRGMVIWSLLLCVAALLAAVSWVLSYIFGG